VRSVEQPLQFAPLPDENISSALLDFAYAALTRGLSLYEMAAQGTSFFIASGDYGDIGDPDDDTDFDAQTIVGGTLLSTNSLVAGGYPTTPTAPATQCALASCYYQSETTWNDGQFGPDVTAGGIMDGFQNADSNNLPNGTAFPSDIQSCKCWPYPNCCPSGVKIPPYQLQLSSVSGEASNVWRNYPDVSMVAQNLDSEFGGQCSGFSGTSGSSPLWAGFMALANQLSEMNHTGHVGFANPALYDIGYTFGQSLDLYSTTFSDVDDGSNNTAGGGTGGFTAVPGYDLATGRGSPTCNLVYQLGTSTPLTPNEPLSHLELLVATGGDNLRQNSQGVATIGFQNGQTIEYLLKSGGAGAVQGPNWQNGYYNDIDIDLSLCNSASPVCVGGPISPLPTPTQGGVSSMTLTLVESDGNSGLGEDNWNVSGLNLRLFSPGSLQEVCQLDRPGGAVLQSAGDGVVRLSATAGTSGSGPSLQLAGGTGCTFSGAPSPSDGDISANISSFGLTEAAVPAASAGIQFIFGTGNDDVRKDSGVSVDIFNAPDDPSPQHIVIKEQNCTGGFPNDSIQNVVYPLLEPFDSNGIPLIDHIVLSLNRSSDPCCCGGPGLCETLCTVQSDNWKLSGLNIMTWQPKGPETCWNMSPAAAGKTDDTTVIVVGPSATLISTGCIGK
jgi:hypothetical protein